MAVLQLSLSAECCNLVTDWAQSAYTDSLYNMRATAGKEAWSLPGWGKGGEKKTFTRFFQKVSLGWTERHNGRWAEWISATGCIKKQKQLKRKGEELISGPYSRAQRWESLAWAMLVAVRDKYTHHDTEKSICSWRNSGRYLCQFGHFLQHQLSSRATGCIVPTVWT